MKTTAGAVVLSVGDITCKDCDQKFVFEGMRRKGYAGTLTEPRCTTGASRALLPVGVLEIDSSKLFCSDCGHRVFGRGLDRAPIIAVDCRGASHRVTFSDCVVYDFTPGHSEIVTSE